jgi:hypothetical protein
MRARRLTEFEVEQARLVFAENLDYARVRVVEQAGWTNSLARFAAWIKREPPPQMANAVGLGRHVFFPQRLRTSPEDVAEGYLVDIAWLMHELTHAWQFQHSGWAYVPAALRIHLTIGLRGYDYGGADGLRKASAGGKALKDFNPEQQGDIARHFYVELKRRRDTSAWDPFVRQLQATSV